MNEFESYRNAKVVDYDSQDVISTEYVCKLNTPQFNIVKRSAHAKGTNYMNQNVEYRRQNCYIPNSGMCFIKCIEWFTYKDYKNIFGSSIKRKNIDQEQWLLLEFNQFVKKISHLLWLFWWNENKSSE